jgi:hypothetical protein
MEVVEKEIGPLQQTRGVSHGRQGGEENGAQAGIEEVGPKKSLLRLHGDYL